MLATLIIIVLFLAYANGANDNFKGVATLYGSGTTTYRKALTWATLTTIAGAIVAIALSSGLVASFSGRGLVTDSIASQPHFSLAVVAGAAVTVMFATLLGFPISTTHALTGGLIGAGLLASRDGIHLSALWTSFFMPLLISPILAFGLAVVMCPWLIPLLSRQKLKRQSCVCITTAAQASGLATPEGVAVAARTSTFEIVTSDAGKADCVQRFDGQVIGAEVGKTVDNLHFLSAGIVCFARASNDAPKIAAVLLLGGGLAPGAGIGLVAIAMAIGGLLHSRRIAETMSNKVTTMNANQGLLANVITGSLVVLASKIGVPVSTTHVSCGSIFGLGAASGKGHWNVIASILAAWVTTLPVAAGLAAGFYIVISKLSA